MKVQTCPVRRTFFLCFLVISPTMLLFLAPCTAFAQDELLMDRNDDDRVSVLAFGNSLTSGVGDGTAIGEEVVVAPSSGRRGGYPARLSRWLGVPVANAGVPGERFADEGLFRVPEIAQLSSADIVLLFGGANDAVFQVPPITFERALQKAINIVQALGKLPVVLTLPEPCCNHDGIDFYTRLYGSTAREVADRNGVPLADVEREWRNACNNPERCEFFNLPEGLHPNTAGYDVIAQIVAARLLYIDLAAEGSRERLADALGLAAEEIWVGVATVQEGEGDDA